MTNNKQQTAVEWLIEQLHRKYGGTDFFWTNMDEIEQAKEMEKEQKANTWNNAINAVEKDKWESFDQYYNETYEGGEQ
jgi:disulfide oxidoreductase YuzD